MNQVIRRILSLIVVLLLVASLLPVTSWALEADDAVPPNTEEATSTDNLTEDGSDVVEEDTENETVPQESEALSGVKHEEVSFYLINNKARAIVDQAVSKATVFTGQFWYDLWYLNKWSGYWGVWGSWWFQEFSYYEFASGAIGYCIQPYNSSAALNQDRVAVTWDDIVTPYASSSDGFEEEKAEGISLAMAYGAPNNGDTTVSGYYATGAVIWAVACGHVRADGTIRDSETPFLKALKDGFWDDPACYAEIEAKYNELLVCLQNHGKIPSFSAGTRAELEDAHTIILQYDVDTGLYTASVTDTNGVLKHFNYQSAIEGISFTRSENTLMITATPAAAAQLGTGIVINSRGHDVVVGPDSVIVWNTEANDVQAMVTMPVAADPVPSCFLLKAPGGEIQIIKSTEDGNNLSGWQFEIYSDAGCTDRIAGPYTTDAVGTILAAGLTPGTVWVKEIGHEDAEIATHYRCEGDNPQQVLVQTGEIATVYFHNRLNAGTAKIVKLATNGGTVEGWEFTIMDDSGNAVGTFTTDAEGVILADLAPGTYVIQETERDDPYWDCDLEPQTVTVNAGETVTVTFQNQWIGKAKIIKNLANPEAGSVEGWKFTITDANGSELGTYQTDSTGTILVDLEPGTYTVKEVLEDKSLWQCASNNPQTINVTAGQTAEVTFTNALRPGEISIQKVNHEGTPLVGAEFLLEWSEDGVNWQSVTYTDSAVVSKGTCSSVGLQDGKLVSSAEGWVVFSGLYPGLQYRLTETKAPAGYQLLTGYAYEGVLPVDGNLTVSLTVVNISVFELPATGSHDAVHLPISVILCLSLCTGLVIYLRKR